MRTMSFFTCAAGVMLLLVLPALSASNRAVVRHVQTERDRLQEVEAHLDDSSEMPKLAEAMRGSMAASEGMLRRTEKLWWVDAITAGLCLLAAGAMFWRSRTAPVTRQRATPPPEFPKA